MKKDIVRPLILLYMCFMGWAHVQVYKDGEVFVTFLVFCLVTIIPLVLGFIDGVNQCSLNIEKKKEKIKKND